MECQVKEDKKLPLVINITLKFPASSSKGLKWVDVSVVQLTKKKKKKKKKK
jgi:hypothetical protein